MNQISKEANSGNSQNGSHTYNINKRKITEAEKEIDEINNKKNKK